MTREDIVRMARQVGYPIHHPEWQKATEEFAALVAAAERNRTWTQDHWTEYERSIAAAAKAEEREACARVCEDLESVSPEEDNPAPWCIAAAIRARGKA